MLFDRVMGKNVILKTSKIPQNRLFMAKNQVQFKDFFKKSIWYVSYILEAYNCQKELRNIKKHGFYRGKTSFFDVFCHLLKTRFSRYRVFSKSYNSLNNAFIDKIFSRDENLHLRADSNRSGILNFCPRVELVGGQIFFAKILGETPCEKIRAEIQNSASITIYPQVLVFVSRKDFVDKRVIEGVIRLWKNAVTRKSRFE